MGWPCLLTGSGMAFPWPVIQNAPLASGHLVEDMQLGLDLAVAGHAPVFCERALVTSEFPSSDEGLSSQRTRWEHGHLGTIQSQLPRLLAQAVRQRRTGLLGLALDLSVPPLSSLILLTLALATVSMGFAALTGLWWATATPMLALLLLGVGTTSAWYRHGQSTLTPQEMLSIGSYVVHKLPVYLNFFTKRQVAWIRTRRDDGSSKQPVTQGILDRKLVCLLGLPIDVIDMAGAIAKVRHAVETRERLFLSTPNLNFLVAAQKDEAFRESVLRSDLSVADGISLVMLGRILGANLPERVTGSDLFEQLAQTETDHPIKVFFFGGPPGAGRRAAERLNQDFTGMTCVGYHEAGFGDIESMSTPDVIDRINASGADFVVAALGAKKDKPGSCTTSNGCRPP